MEIEPILSFCVSSSILMATATVVVVVATAAFVVLIEKYCNISFNLKTTEKKTDEQIVKTDVRRAKSHTHKRIVSIL